MSRKNYLDAVFTCHCNNAEGEVAGYVYERPTGGYISVIEVKVREFDSKTIYHPTLPKTFGYYGDAVEYTRDAVIDFDWKLDHPHYRSEARVESFNVEELAMKMATEDHLHIRMAL